MSIPPLVCSTPPPPDQCEDENDHEDFDIQYNLSQDEDDDNYDFGSFSTFNHFQSSQNKGDHIITKVVESDKIDVPSHKLQEKHENVKENTAEQNEQKFEEEMNVEDLNLEDLKAAQDTAEKIPDITTNVESEICNPEIDIVQPPATLQNLADDNSTVTDINTSDLQPDELDIEPCSIDQPEEPPSYVDEIIAAVENLHMTPTEPELPLDISEVDEPMQEFESNCNKIEKQESVVTSEVKEQELTVTAEIEKQEFTVTSEQVTEIRKDVIADDDFGDFDDFQFANPNDPPETLLSCDNPWDKNDDTTNDDFGNFKANFDNNESNTFSTFPKEPEHSLEVKTEDQESSTAVVPADDDDDDFGDFNDFQASSSEMQLATGSEDLELPFLDVQLPDDKLMEFVTSIINEIYEEEVPELKEETEVTLDSVLGVTWGHLLQTDERQPYMVNWNNSLGQKTLLKALCIDSRNILFGPKWSYNMPKYAATLTAAPLQPLKQITLPSSSQAEPHPEKSTSKSSGTWSDPFTSDGQESCNPDAPSENPVNETGPTDLDVFEASTSSKPDKIFSSTLNIQPLRQISLPDTHIFTPTDSETPRSTTIHYDNSPTVLLPQTVIETKSETSFKSEHQTLPPKSSADDNDEYWEFQDFKGSKATGPSNTPSSISETSKPNKNIIYATQVLQPVKVEPVIPTLNWPDPGEVKETFDDFSDFVSSNPPQQTTEAVPTVVNKPANDLEIAGPSKALAAPDERPTNDTAGDDDFDTFQSALPSTSSVPFNFSNVSKDSNTVVGKPTISSPAPPALTTDFDFAFPKVDNAKSNTISFENKPKAKDTFMKNQIPMPIYPNNLEVKSPPVQVSSTVMNTGLLQPTPASLNATLPSQQKTGQILQPLSLESFSQINWPNPGIDLQDLSRFNPVETLHSLKSDLSVNSQSKVASPVHSQKNPKGAASNQSPDDDWGDFVSSAPKPQQQAVPKNQPTFADDDEWTDFVSSPSVKPQNGLNTISLNVHTNFQSKPIKLAKGKKVPLEIPSLNYITPKSGSHKSYNDRHLNL